MKVLFAVSSEEISEKIIKRYQKEYKEILSYKNVYYFNAILKEIQKDKTYDRIVISEDLEPFANNNYDTIDKFIFDKLDSISDEAHDNQGKETAIILICTERRTKGSSILLKLFGIGIYNALLGNDRSMEQVCKLINRPRGKKEAKQYYQIDTEDVNYRAENENEVSELEIQNILTHFKKLGRNTDRYADSFNNIAAQYTEEQLKIIINCLPINIKAVLEEKCPKYQEIMAVTGGARVGGTIPSGQKLKNAGLRIDIIKNNEKQQMNGPIVIPSTLRTIKAGKSPNIQKPVSKASSVNTSNANVATNTVANTAKIVNNVTNNTASGATNVANAQSTGRAISGRRIVQTHKPAEMQNTVQNVQVSNMQNQNTQKTNIQAQATQNISAVNSTSANSKVVSQVQTSAVSTLNTVGNESENLNEIETKQETVKKGRGRPRKILSPEDIKPKGKRGRPRKIEAQEENTLPDLEEENNILPGLDDSMLPGMEEISVPEVEESSIQNTVPASSNTSQPTSEDDLDGLLPGLEDDDINNLLPDLDDDSILPGMEEDSVPEVEDTLPGVEGDILPGLDSEEDNISELNEEDDGLLPGIEEIPEENNIHSTNVENSINSNRRVVTSNKQNTSKIEPIASDDDISSLLPETDFGEDEEGLTEEVSLPGLDELDDFEDINQVNVPEDDLDGLLPGIEESAQENNQANTNEVVDYNDNAEDLLPGLDEEDETLLPGMGFEDDSNDQIASNPVQSNVQKPKPAHSYTVKSGGLRARNLIPSKKSSMKMPQNNVAEDNQNYSNYENYDNLDNMEAYNTYDNFDSINDLGNNVNTQAATNNYNQNSYQNNYNNNAYQEDYSSYDNSNEAESLKPKVDYSMSSLNSLLTQDKKIVTFIGTTKNGTSFLVNNLASIFSSLGINTAILDMTKNRNSYYIYTKNEEELRKIAYNSMEKLENGYAEGIKVDKNLTVYTALPNDGKVYTNAEPILSTLVQNHSVILIDCDFDTDPAYFASCQEIYLVQSLDILTIQPLTAFLRDLKTKGVLEPEKVRVVINKDMKVGNLTNKVIIAGMSFYNDPAMSFMTELFNKDMVKYCVIPFDEKAYAKYLEAIVDCRVSYNSYPSNFINKLKTLGDMVYPLTSKQAYGKQTNTYSKPNNSFSNSMNNTLNKMRKKY